MLQKTPAYYTPSLFLQHSSFVLITFMDGLTCDTPILIHCIHCSFFICITSTGQLIAPHFSQSTATLSTLFSLTTRAKLTKCFQFLLLPSKTQHKYLLWSSFLPCSFVTVVIFHISCLCHITAVRNMAYHVSFFTSILTNLPFQTV